MFERDHHEDRPRDDQDTPHPSGDPLTNDREGHHTLEQVSDLSHAAPYDLVRPCDVKGILHSHSRYCDGAHTLESMVVTAREIGLEYLGVSDHFRSDVHRDGITLDRAKAQRDELEDLRRRYPDVDLLQGVEVDADDEGALMLDDEILEFFDYVIASVPDKQSNAERSLTDQVMAVAANPCVTILGRPVGDYMLRRDNDGLDMEQVLQAAATGGTAVEINANPCCAELDWNCCKRAQELGVAMVISPDAHRAARLVDFRHGAELAQDAGLYCSSILNTLTAAELRSYITSGSMPES
ncbi:MAG: hypothetical protein GY838_03030 [bacterium]|nr:hypothetical protein [bacterium]